MKDETLYSQTNIPLHEISDNSIVNFASKLLKNKLLTNGYHVNRRQGRPGQIWSGSEETSNLQRKHYFKRKHKT